MNLPARSVRARLTIVVTMLSAVAFAAIALIAPGSVKKVLEDDLIEAEAASAYAFTQLVGPDSFDPTNFVLDENGQPISLGPGTVIAIEGPAFVPDEILEQLGLDPETNVLEEITATEEFGVDASDPISVATADVLVSDQIELLQSVDAFDSLIDASDGRFATDLDPLTIAVIESDGSFEIVEGDAASVNVPVLTQFELDEYLFDDLGIFETQSGSVIDVDTTGRIAFAVREVEGLQLLVAADVTSVDRSVSRVRSGLWLASFLLTLAVAAIAWVVTSRALRPVRSITEQAATITSGSLDARVPVPGSGDEIATLAETVNEMLNRLEMDDRTRRQFISDASHELRSPVAVMRNEAEVALHHPNAADIEELAGTIAAESKRMATIIDDLLALARHDEDAAAPTTEVDLDDLVLREAARARRVVIDVAGVSAGRVRGRSDELSRMVGHLLDNAARHAANTVAVSLQTAHDRVDLVVDDDGPGVDLADRDRIFERFARLDDARTRDQGGAGLGLAVVHGTAQRSGGTVNVGDSPLGGARFTVSFPA